MKDHPAAPRTVDAGPQPRMIIKEGDKFKVVFSTDFLKSVERSQIPTDSKRKPDTDTPHVRRSLERQPSVAPYIRTKLVEAFFIFKFANIGHLAKFKKNTIKKNSLQLHVQGLILGPFYITFHGDSDSEIKNCLLNSAKFW